MAVWSGHQFLPTPSAWRATATKRLLPTLTTFLPTPSAWRATVDSTSTRHLIRPISTHALRMEGDFVIQLIEESNYQISIHALRMEGDSLKLKNRRTMSISIHALRMEGDGGMD